MKLHTRLTPILLIALALSALAGCRDSRRSKRIPTETFLVTIENLSATYEFPASGAFDTPVGAGAPAPIGPGEAYEFRVAGLPGDRLSFATMFVQSNDLFYAPDGAGIALFDASDLPVSGDVTGQVFLWDAGTEANEEPGLGPNQAPRQAGADTGPADGDTSVRLVADGFLYPPVAAVIRVTVTPLGGNEFLVRIENVSDSTTLTPSSGPSLAVPLAPGVFVVHDAPNPLFTDGSADSGDGLEALAEDGEPSGLAAMLEADTGVTTPLAPGAFAVHGATMPIFVEGQPDAGRGLEALAEDGDSSGLAAFLGSLAGVNSAGAFSVPDGAPGPGPLLPGGTYRFTFAASAGERLSFATMYVQSNDLFFAFIDEGLLLFDAQGNPREGDVTSEVMLWDAGTELNQWPGAGPDQAPRQAGPDTGAADANSSVRLVTDGFEYGLPSEVVRVTVTVVR